MYIYGNELIYSIGNFKDRWDQYDYFESFEGVEYND